MPGILGSLLKEASEKTDDNEETKQAIVLIGNEADRFETDIVGEINTICAPAEAPNPQDQQSAIEKFVGVKNEQTSAVRDLTVHAGIINYFYLDGSKERQPLNIYAVSPLDKTQKFPITAEDSRLKYHCVLLVDLSKSLEYLEAKTVGKQSLEDSMLGVVKEWKATLKQMESEEYVDSFSVAVVGCDAVEYNFRSLKKIDLIQQVVRVICLEENSSCQDSGCVVYLKNGGADTARVAQFLDVLLESKQHKIDVDDYDSIFVAAAQDSFAKIRTVNGSFDCEFWSETWRSSESEKVVAEDTSKQTTLPSISDVYQRFLAAEFKAVE